MCSFVGRELAHRNREWLDVIGSIWSRKGELAQPSNACDDSEDHFRKVYQLISRRRFQQMEVLEGQNILVTISGKKNRVRVYYLSWLKSKILRTDGLSDVSHPCP